VVEGYIGNANGCYRYIVDDRKLYKPKEQVHIRGYIRRTVKDEINSI
jgi:uncharacterized protein YfaS (alpha-2-macroglobulin family)